MLIQYLEKKTICRFAFDPISFPGCAHTVCAPNARTYIVYYTSKLKSLAKRGAQVALGRTFGVSAENHVGFDVGGDEDGPMRAPDAEQLFIGGVRRS